MADQCQHLDQIEVYTTDKYVCEDCEKIGGTWVHLRMCMTCGHVGCCNSSPNKHATQHYHETNHPLIRSAELGDTWVYCYIDEAVVAQVDS